MTRVDAFCHFVNSILSVHSRPENTFNWRMICWMKNLNGIWLHQGNFPRSEQHLRPVLKNILFSFDANAPQRARASSFTRFLDHTQRRTTVGRTPLDEWSARRRDLYLTTHNRQTSMPPVVFEPTISAGERPQTYALDRAATETGEEYIGVCTFKDDREL